MEHEQPEAEIFECCKLNIFSISGALKTRKTINQDIPLLQFGPKSLLENWPKHEILSKVDSEPQMSGVVAKLTSYQESSLAEIDQTNQTINEGVSTYLYIHAHV